MPAHRESLLMALPQNTDRLIEWINTVITMDSADPHYGNTQGQSTGVTNSGFTTVDGGKTWKVTTINIPTFTF